MIFITGDTHNNIDVHKLTRSNFNYEGLTKDDYMIICGDFGFVWYGNRKDNWWLNWLENLPCTILWCDGNHENFDALKKYPVSEWHGGKVQFIRPHIIHLMRGEIYTIENKKFFVMGGANSHDKEWRTEHISWWKEELPSKEEEQNALDNLAKHNNKVDFVITHGAPSHIVKQIDWTFNTDPASQFLEKLENIIDYDYWYFGHYHMDVRIDEKHSCLYDYIKRIN